MRARDWAGVDHYRELGVRPTATRDEIIAAYRAWARVLHPDAGPSDPAAKARFVRVTEAYRVLSGPRREEYDRARRCGQLRRPAPGHPRGPWRASGGGPTPAGTDGRPWPLTRRGARAALWAGIALVLAGFAAAAVVIGLHARDARLRAEGVPVDGLVVREGGVVHLEFRTREGVLVRTGLPDAKSGAAAAGDVVAVRYDRNDPERVVMARPTLARDITLWIVAAKLLVAGLVLAVVGARRLCGSAPAPG